MIGYILRCLYLPKKKPITAPIIAKGKTVKTIPQNTHMPVSIRKSKILSQPISLVKVAQSKPPCFIEGTTFRKNASIKANVSDTTTPSNNPCSQYGKFFNLMINRHNTGIYKISGQNE
jgi:hypothetical protein